MTFYEVVKFLYSGNIDLQSSENLMAS